MEPRRAFEGRRSHVTAAESAAVERQLGYVPSNMVGVAVWSTGSVSREPTPAVLLLYPLRSHERAHKRHRRVTVEPFPTLYWLCACELRVKVSALEENGAMEMLQRRLDGDKNAQEAIMRSHEAYSRRRWMVLTPTDQQLVAARGWTRALCNVGVAGIRKPTRLKCLHAHYAHYLAMGDNVVGQWVDELLRGKTVNTHRDADRETLRT